MEPVIDILRDEFGFRRLKNLNYSLRAFSRDLKISAATLSQVLSRKRGVSKRLIRALLQQDFHDPNAKERLFQIDSGLSTANSYDRLKFDSAKTLSEAQIACLEGWYHFAILSLAKTKDFKSHPRWIARRLGLEEKIIREAITRLHRLRLIRLGRNNRISVTSNDTTTSHNLPSAALRAHHAQKLRLSCQALEKLDIEKRDITSVVLVSDRESIKVVREHIARFRRNLVQLLEQNSADEVFCLNVQFFQISQ